MKALYAGCGGDHLPEWLGDHEEVRLDIDARCNPDIVADMKDLGDIGPFDVIYCSHSLEHLYPHECRKALSEFYRVLGKNGRLIVIVPDLEDVKPTEDVVYVSPGGPITGLDMIYGARWLLEQSPYMAHHNGFTKVTLESVMRFAGFEGVQAIRDPNHNLVAVGVKLT